jgi:AAA+ superfamily predicted ATPase
VLYLIYILYHMYSQKEAWAVVESFYDKLRKCTEEGEWIGAYINLQLAILSCKQLLDMPRAPAASRAAAKNNASANATPLSEHDPEASLNVLLGLLPRYKAMVKRFQQHFGCPPKSNAGDGESLESECADLKAVDIEKALGKNTADVVLFNTLIGNTAAVREIQSSIIYPFTLPHLYPKLTKGILFYGPAGTGKTLLAKATAYELCKHQKDSIQVLFYAPTADKLKGKFLGETEKKITNLFRCASHGACELERKTSKRAIAIIFLDEIDSIARNRSGGNDPSGVNASATNTLLQMMDGVSSFPNLLVLSATNLPWDIDSAILRRFQSKIYVAMPSKEDIAELLKQQIAKWITRVIFDSETVFDSSNCSGFRWSEAFDSLAWLHTVKEAELKGVAAKLAEKRFAPRDISHLCKQAFMAQAAYARQNCGFHEVACGASGASEPPSVQMGDPASVCRALQGKYISGPTYRNIKKHHPYVIDDRIAMYPSNVSFPLKIVVQSETYNHHNIIKQLPAYLEELAKHMPEHIRLYFRREADGETTGVPFLMHRTMLTSVKSSVAEVSLMLAGTLTKELGKRSGLLPTFHSSHVKELLPTFHSSHAKELLQFVTKLYIHYKGHFYVININDASTKKASSRKVLPSAILDPKSKTYELGSTVDITAMDTLAGHLVTDAKLSVHSYSHTIQVHYTTDDQTTDEHGSDVKSKCCNFVLDVDRFYDKIKKFTVANSQRSIDDLDHYHDTGKPPAESGESA